MTLPGGLLVLIDPLGRRIEQVSARASLGRAAVSAEVLLPAKHPPIQETQVPDGEAARIEALWVPGCTEEDLHGWRTALGGVPGLFIDTNEQVHALGSSLGAPFFLRRLPRLLLRDSQLLADNSDASLSMGRLLENFVQEFGSPQDALPHVCIATGYLYTLGLFRLLDLLENPKIESLHLLFSGKTDQPTARALTSMLEMGLQEGAELASPGSWARLVEAARSQRLQVRVYPDAFLHAKLFLAYDRFDKHGRLQHSRAVIGSSNISSSGLAERGNLELNAALNNADQNTDLLRWFEGRWQEGCAPEPALMEILDRQTPPADPSFQTEGLEQVYRAGLRGEMVRPGLHLALLAELYRSRLAGLEPPREAAFLQIPGATLWPTVEQQVGVHALAARLQRARLAFLADSVGLGKTITAIGTAWYLKRVGQAQRVALIAPDKLRGQWQLDAKNVGAPGDLFHFINRHLIERMDATQAAEQLAGCDLLVVEEAHEVLRSRGNKLWKTLREHLRLNRQCRLLLLSATPWNNRREDILNYLLLAWNDARLLCEHYPELDTAPLRDSLAQFAIVPAGSLPAAAAVRWFDQLPLERYRQIFDRTFVQRTRTSLARRYFQQLDFPERLVQPHTVPSSPLYDQLFALLKGTLPQLFVPYREPFDALQRALRTIRQQDEQPGSNLRRSFLIQLYKRAESSIFALAVSLATIERRLDDFESTLKKLCAAASPGAALREWLDAEYTRLDDLDDGESGPLTAAEKVRLRNARGLMEGLDDAEAGRLLQGVIDDQITSDRQHVRDLRAAIPLAVEVQAPKDLLVDKLARRAFDAGHKPVLIAGYADTAMRTFLRLIAQCPDARIALALGGGEAWVSTPSHQRTTLTQTEWISSLSKPPNERRELLLFKSERAARQDRELVMAAFAPRARQTSKEQLALLGGEIDILIGSEAIGVGQNLQDSSCLIHLDMPWNPMVLEQRIGRIDRRGGGRVDPARPDGRKIVDVHYCWSPAAVEQEVDLRERLRSKATGAVNDTNFDEVLLMEVKAHIDQTRAERRDSQGFVGEDQAIREILDRQQRELAAQQEMVPGIVPGSGSEQDALRLLSCWLQEHPDTPAPPPVVVAAMEPNVAFSTPESQGGWLLTLAVTPLSAQGEELGREPLLFHFSVPAAQGSLPPSDLEALVQRLHLGGAARGRPGVGRGTWATSLTLLDRLLQAWVTRLVTEHNDELRARLAAQQAPAAQRNPSERVRKLVVEARDSLSRNIKEIAQGNRERLLAIGEQIKFLVGVVLDPSRAHELLAEREEGLIEQDLLFIRDLTRSFLIDQFEETFDRLCGERWQLHRAASAQPSLPGLAASAATGPNPAATAPVEGVWHRARVRVLAVTWCTL